MAREVQLAMLPPSAEDTPSRRWRFQAHYEPAGGVSGDFYQLIRISDTEAGVLVCDVMGHGVRSAFITGQPKAATNISGNLLYQSNRRRTAIRLRETSETIPVLYFRRLSFPL